MENKRESELKKHALTHRKKRRSSKKYRSGIARQIPIPNQVKKEYLNTVINYFNDSDGCILWPFATKGGKPYLKSGKSYISARRYVLEIFSGTGKEGDTCNACNKNSLCINPNHLTWGRVSDNLGEYLRGSENE